MARPGRVRVRLISQVESCCPRASRTARGTGCTAAPASSGPSRSAENAAYPSRCRTPARPARRRGTRPPPSKTPRPGRPSRNARGCVNLVEIEQHRNLSIYILSKVLKGAGGTANNHRMQKNSFVLALAAVALVTVVGRAQAPEAAGQRGAGVDAAQPLRAPWRRPPIQSRRSGSSSESVSRHRRRGEHAHSRHPEGLIVADTKNPGDQIFNDLFAQIKSVSNLPVKYIFNTHHHPDHVGNTRNSSIWARPSSASIG